MIVSPEIEYFVDTNVLVYACDLSAGIKHSVAVELMEGWWEYRNGCISIQILQEFYVTITRKITLPVEGTIARQLVADLAQWRLHSPQINDLLEAIDLQQTHRLSFWDAMALQSAARMGCRKFVSEDLGHLQKYGELEVINPFVE